MENDLSPPSHICPDARLDIRHETCPMTFVRTRLALDALPEGAVLEVTLRGAEPRQNVRRSAEALGHLILSETPGPDEDVVLTIRKMASVRS